MQTAADKLPVSRAGRALLTIALQIALAITLGTIMSLAAAIPLANAGEPVPENEPVSEAADDAELPSPAEASSDDTPVLAEFKAIYRLKRGGYEVAEAVMEVRRTQDDIYRYTSHSEALGMLSLFVRDKIDEVSVFRITDDGVQPLSYSYRHKGSSKNRNEDITYDWTAGIAETEYRGEKGKVELEPGAVDRFLLPVVVGMGTDLATLDKRVPVIDNGKVKYWHLAATGEELLKTPAGSFRTIRVERIDKDLDKTVRFWLAPELNYLPVRIEQIKRNEEPLRLTIQSLK